MTHRDFYQVLGIPRGASPSDIRAAFVRLTKRHHPDLADGDAKLPWRLQEVQQAYRCLSDAAARTEHDAALDDHQRRHVARQRAVQRRLRVYDRRHPRHQPRARRGMRWRLIAMAAIGAAIVARMSLRLIG